MLKVGVIGTGNIGTDHVRRIASSVAGASIVAVFDVDTDRAAAVGAEVGAVAHSRAADVIEDPAVDAVIVASPGDTHAELALACLQADKPLLCEKPLATTSAAALEVVAAEAALGRRLIQVGFMRRYDSGYRLVKTAIDDGTIGAPLLAHCIHRNASAPPGFTSEMSMTDSVVHEIDVARWLFGAEIVAATAVPTRPSPLAPPGMRDPQLVLFELANGSVVEVESFVGCQYGYDVRCEVVGSTGTVSLDTPGINTILGGAGQVRPVAADWRVRFADAYRVELQDWVDAVRSGELRGPDGWDGYAATAVAESCVESLRSGERTVVRLTDRPKLYS